MKSRTIIAAIAMTLALGSTANASPGRDKVVRVLQSSPFIHQDPKEWNLKYTSDMRLRFYDIKIMKALEDAQYPEKLYFTDKKDKAEYEQAKRGWGVRKDCDTLDASIRNVDRRINEAKVIYCHVKKAGFPIPLPWVIQGWKD